MFNSFHEHLWLSVVRALGKKDVDCRWLTSPSVLPVVAKGFFLMDFEDPKVQRATGELHLPDEPPQECFPAVSKLITVTLTDPEFPPYMAAAFEQKSIPVTPGWQAFFEEVLSLPDVRQLVRGSLIANGRAYMPPVVVQTAMINDPSGEPVRGFSIRIRE